MVTKTPYINKISVRDLLMNLESILEVIVKRQ